MSNSIIDIYTSLNAAYNSGSNTTVTSLGQNLTSVLSTLDLVLLTNPAFQLSAWINAARAWSSNSSDELADFYEYNARNQITLWGPNGEVTDYASKSWGGLVKGYYIPRWEIFLQYLGQVAVEGYNATELKGILRVFEQDWQTQTSSTEITALNGMANLQDVLGGLEGSLPGLF
jgi:alpha-N-acetylglucosaminidase